MRRKGPDDPTDPGHPSGSTPLREHVRHTDVFSASPVRPAAVRRGALTVEEYFAALASPPRLLRGATGPAPARE
jgi:hypothetical protein